MDAATITGYVAIYIAGFAPDATPTIGERIIDHKQYTAYIYTPR